MKQKEIDKIEELVKENSTKLTNLIEEFVKTEEKKEALGRLFDGDIAWLYLSAPASSREKYHNAFFGGLFEHSMNVFQNLAKANKAWDLGFSDESMFIVALLHDLGKACTPDLKSPHYIEAKEWLQNKGINFDYDYSKGYFTNRDRTMFVLQHFGVKLSPEEYSAILLNDGLILDANKAYSMKEYDLAWWTQVADCWAAKCESPQPYNKNEKI